VTVSLESVKDSDHFGLSLGDWVFTKKRIESKLPNGTKLFHADPISIGQVVGLEQGCYPTIYFPETGTVIDCHNGEIEKLCGPDLVLFPYTNAGNKKT
jgi:hypothetical protein